MYTASQICLDGGPLDVNKPADPVAGRPLLRHQLLLGSSGPGAAGAGAATADLAVGLQRILLVAKAVGQLQQQSSLGSSSVQSTGSSGAAVAVQTLVQVGRAVLLYCSTMRVSNPSAFMLLASAPRVGLGAALTTALLAV